MIRYLTLLGLLAAGWVARAEEVSAPPAGLKVLSAGHSFHVWMPPLLAEMANAAGIKDHQQLAISSIGGSKLIQHWQLPLERNKAKPVLEKGEAELLTMAGTFLPDEGIVNFVKLGLEHNSKIRFTLQQNWVPFEDPELWQQRVKPSVVERDSKTVAQIREKNEPYFKLIEDHVRALNTQIPAARIAIVPSGEAVILLREKVIKGECPGVQRQSELFSDPLGHPNAQIKCLSAYCHFVVIYRRNPLGLPVPKALAPHPEAAKLNTLLQQLAWKAVTANPLSGVTAAK